MSRFIWDRNTIEVLINQWGKHPHMYNSSHKLYENKKKRNESLFKIKNELKKLAGAKHITIGDIRKKLNTLRCQYTREFNRYLKFCRQAGHSLDDLYQPTLWCYQQMEFLKPEYSKALKDLTLLNQKKRSGSPEVIVPPAKRRKKECAASDLQKQLVAVSNLISKRTQNKYKWLGKQIATQMDEIQDDQLREEASCAIHSLIREYASNEELDEEKPINLDSTSNSTQENTFSDEHQQSSIDLKTEMVDDSEDSMQFLDGAEMDRISLQKNISKTSINNESDIENIENPLSPPNNDELDDIIIEEDDIFIPKASYVKEAIKGNLPEKLSRKLIALHEERTKAETIYFRKKATYFHKQTENLEVQRKLMILQAQKLRLEIEKIHSEF